MMSDALTDLIVSMPSAEPAEIAEAIRARFTLVEKQSVWEADTEPEPAKGQFWRNKESGRLVRISAFHELYRGLGEARLVVWERADDSRGPKNGRVQYHYWKSRFKYVGEAES